MVFVALCSFLIRYTFWFEYHGILLIYLTEIHLFEYIAIWNAHVDLITIWRKMDIHIYQWHKYLKTCCLFSNVCKFFHDQVHGCLFMGVENNICSWPFALSVTSCDRQIHFWTTLFLVTLQCNYTNILKTCMQIHANKNKLSVPIVLYINDYDRILI